MKGRHSWDRLPLELIGQRYRVRPFISDSKLRHQRYKRPPFICRAEVAMWQAPIRHRRADTCKVQVREVHSGFDGFRVSVQGSCRSKNVRHAFNLGIGLIRCLIRAVVIKYPRIPSPGRLWVGTGDMPRFAPCTRGSRVVASRLCLNTRFTGAYSNFLTFAPLVTTIIRMSLQRRLYSGVSQRTLKDCSRTTYPCRKACCKAYTAILRTSS